MREAFAHQLAGLETRLEDALRQAADVLTQIGQALTTPGAQSPASIRARADDLRAASRSTETELVVLAARQTPVAGDLRLVLALIQVAHHGALISNQFVLISEQLELVDPAVIDRNRTSATLAEMAALAARQLQQAVHAFASRDDQLARRLEPDDDGIDRLNRQVFHATLGLDAAPDQRELAMRHVLIARSLERIGDNAVDIGEQAAFVVSAELHEFSDASHPRRTQPSRSSSP